MAEPVRNLPAASHKQQPAATPESPYYTKDNIPEDCTPGARWLFAKGCKCLGHPNWPSAAWLLPGRNEYETSRRVEKKAWMRKVVGRDKGGPIVELKEAQVMEQDGANPNNMGQPVRPVTQLRITPAARPVSFQQAVATLQAIEAQARREAAKAAAKEAAAKTA